MASKAFNRPELISSLCGMKNANVATINSFIQSILRKHIVSEGPLGWAQKLLTGLLRLSVNLKSLWDEKCNPCDNKSFHSDDIEDTHHK